MRAMERRESEGHGGISALLGLINHSTQNPFPAAPEAALELINTQYWIETHYNWYETFANMRRSGYPKIYEQLSDGTELSRRLTYPPTEVAINPNVQNALERQGPDVTTTRVCWDK